MLPVATAKDVRIFTAADVRAMASGHQVFDRAPASPVVWLDLPYPPRTLSPNQPMHYRLKAQAVLRHKALVASELLQQLTPSTRRTLAGMFDDPATGVWVGLLIVPPDRRRRDLDNVLASLKSTLDTLADALDIDDSRISVLCARMSRSIVPHGMVRAAIAVATNEGAATPAAQAQPEAT